MIFQSAEFCSFLNKIPFFCEFIDFFDPITLPCPRKGHIRIIKRCRNGVDFAIRLVGNLKHLIGYFWLKNLRKQILFQLSPRRLGVTRTLSSVGCSVTKRLVRSIGLPIKLANLL